MIFSSKTKRLPFNTYYFITLSLVAVGLLDSLYLSISHYRVYTDIAYQSFCAISKAINCDTVSQSPYSILWGVPVPVWGVLGYAFLGGIVLLAGRNRGEEKPLWAFIQVTALGFCCYSIVLALISTYLIKSYCIMCILTYGVNLGVLFSAWIIRRRFELPPIFKAFKTDWNHLKQNKIKSAVVVGLPVLVSGILMVLFPNYWQLTSSQMDVKVSVGLTEEGHPYFGDLAAETKIVEFTDYQCFQCRKMHYYLRNLIAKNPGRAVLIHRHFPMDHEVNPGLKIPYHLGSGKMALLAVYASAKGKFWAMNDLLFTIAARQADFNLKEIAQRSGIDPGELARALNNKMVYQRLAMDIKAGGELGLEGTPGFLIDGDVYQGNIPPEILARIFTRQP